MAPDIALRLLRRATASDAAAIRTLTRAAYAKWVALIGREPKPMVADYDAAVQAHRIDLLCIDHELVALVEMVPEPGCLLVENVAVAPACQGRGYGTLLMEHAEHVAADLGCATIRLFTNQLFTANLRLYRKLGYRVDREQAFAAGILVHMSKLVTRRS